MSDPRQPLWNRRNRLRRKLRGLCMACGLPKPKGARYVNCFPCRLEAAARCAAPRRKRAA